MCFRPPALNKLMARCPACNTFNPPTNKQCKKCGADLPEEQKDEDLLQNKDKNPEKDE